MKRITATLCAFLIIALSSAAQSPIYSFTVTSDTAIESNALFLAGYVKADVAPTSADTLQVVLTAGVARPSHIDSSQQFIITFVAGIDSVPFFIQLYDDTFTEYTAHLTYTLRDIGNVSNIGIDSILNFTLFDNDSLPTISFLTDSQWSWRDRDTFINGVYDPYPSPFYVGIKVNNPNPFYVKYVADNLDCYRTSGLPNITACGAPDFYFNGETCYAAPGISIYYKEGSTKQQPVSPDKYFYCILRNADDYDSNIPDSVLFFTIKSVDYYDPPSVAFDQTAITIIRDTAIHLGIPITIQNDNRKPLYYYVDTMNLHSTFPGPDFSIGNINFGYGHGTTMDTVWLDVIDRHLINDTVNATFVIRGVIGNTSPDTLFNLTIIDTGTLVVSFKGAGFAHLKDDSIGYVQVYTSSPVTFPVTANVSYLNGDAVMGVDFLWRDTTVTFPAFLADTISLPVIMLKNHIHNGNKQINLLLSNVNPSSVQYDIIQYTYIIIDNDSTAAYQAGIIDPNNPGNIKIYPNPFDKELNIYTSSDNYQISITNMMGQKVYGRENQAGNAIIYLSDLPAGAYLLRISNGNASYVKLITRQ